MSWIITEALEPVYVDDKEPNRFTDSMDCMMCPCETIEECKARNKCYWDEVWNID